MPRLPEHLIADAGRFVHDTVDGETLRLDNETRHLLLIGGFGVSLWPRLVDGAAASPAPIKPWACPGNAPIRRG